MAGVGPTLRISWSVFTFIGLRFSLESSTDANLLFQTLSQVFDDSGIHHHTFPRLSMKRRTAASMTLP